MSRELFHIYGPFSINAYGATIACAIMMFLYMINQHPMKKKLFSTVDILQPISMGIFIGIIGGRALFVLTNYSSFSNPLEILAIWNGGFSVLGAICAIIICMPWYLRSINITVLPFFDLIAIHAPFLQSISRLGCFFAGCCYGKTSTGPFTTIYTNTDTFAPLNVCLHPTQLYSSLSLLLIFCFMYFIAQNLCQKPGQLTALYLILASMCRFTIDFWRGDQEFFGYPYIDIFSINQWISMIMMLLAAMAFIYFSTWVKNITDR